MNILHLHVNCSCIHELSECQLKALLGIHATYCRFGLSSSSLLEVSMAFVSGMVILLWEVVMDESSSSSILSCAERQKLQFNRSKNRNSSRNSQFTIGNTEIPFNSLPKFGQTLIPRDLCCLLMNARYHNVLSISLYHIIRSSTMDGCRSFLPDNNLI